ncbi:MAG: hypothetical protein IPN30_13875 [Flavobacteriales bacterium]|nr:hypothetical protein [Flavobacteriales bacterium]
MSERNEFDELARRKLEERGSIFRESDWSAAERLIAAQRRTSGGWKHWAIGAVALILIGAATWWINADPAAEKQLGYTALQHANGSASVAPPVDRVESEPASNSDQQNAQQDGAGTENSIKSPSTNAPKLSGTGTTDISMPAISASQHRSSTPKKSKKDRSRGTEPSPTGRSSAPVDSESETTLLPKDADTFTALLTREDPPVITDDQEEETTSAPNTNAVVPNLDPVSTNEPASDTTDGSSDLETSARTTVATEPPLGEEMEGVDEMHPMSILQDRTEEVVGMEVPGVYEAPPTTEPGSDRTNAEGGHAEAVIGVESDAMNSTRTQDSALTVPPEVSPMSVVPASSPWEIGVLFGGLRSTSKYTDGNSAEWSDGLKGHWAPAFGAEVMRMGRNFGIGSGIHYSTYEEELTVEARSLTNTVIRDSNYFQPIDTTLLYVLGNVVIDGQEWYVTESRDTTIIFLILGTNTFSSTRQLIDALRVVNRVSYVEIPLLLDAHVTQGPWMLGLRGGPTIGVLTGRRGTLPNAEFDGYTPFTTEQFRRTQLGVTARAYIRYKFGNGWSLGVEPTWRTQLGNAFSSGDLVRTNSGVGGMFSVTYRLR